MQNKVRTVTPEGALKKMNFQPGVTLKGKEKVDEVLPRIPKRWRNGTPPTKYPSIIMRGGIPHKIVDGKWVALTKVTK